ncbi:hypothetical protein GCM10009804_55390 [Kribbella hippodromi]|uniref:Neutral zinc metallopeptidase n=2 Tax=Kribbella hippodromi TaxID=434347 RepID=A0ABP4PX72_9ACTN
MELMVNLSRTTLRGLATAGVLAGFAATLVLPAQAAQTSGSAATAATAGSVSTAATQAAATPKPILLDGTGMVAGPPPAGEGLTTKASTTNVVRYNRLYKTGPITPSKCKEVNVSLRTHAGVVAYDTQLFKCIYASWALPLKQAGAAYKVAPRLIFHQSSAVNSPCGVVRGGTAFYCGYGNGLLYIPTYTVTNFWKQSPTFARAYATNTLSHEYGHHVQFLTGILGASWQRQRAISTYAGQMEESRRRELQASCLGSADIGANKRYYPMSGGLYQQWVYLVQHSGDQSGGARDHGSMKNHGWWSQAGFYAASSKTYAGRCNTFNAASSAVS